MKATILIAFSLSLAFEGLGQLDTDKFQLIKKIPTPEGLKWGIPNEIMIDSTFKILVISYDYNPTYLEFHDIDSWEKMARVKIRGHTYLGMSYFNHDHNCVYILKGKTFYSYIKVDLSDFSISNVNSKKTRNNCHECTPASLTMDHNKKTRITTLLSDRYALRYDETMTEIYLTK